MIPLRDNIPSRTPPVVNYVLIGACGAVFLYQLSLGREVGKFFMQYGMIPKRIANPDKPIIVPEQRIVRDRWHRARRVTVPTEAPAPPFHVYLTFLTSIFMHGGWMHFLGNMLFLYIFGDNVEDRLGHWGYLIFYLAAGVVASLAHFATNVSSTVPTIGASGAIAGVMGAYLLLYPHAQVLTLVPIFYFIELINLPAVLFLGLWFVLQFFQGVAALSAAQTTGVAWWAHIGGFAAGAGVVWLLGRVNLLRTPLQRAIPVARPFRHYRYHSRGW